ncbi:MAG: hypothetical protein Q4D02_04000 [Clostridia bacterium]|nr:hypothetical protein [Clostridia bacterium]
MRHDFDRLELPFIMINDEVIQKNKVEIVDEKNGFKIEAAVFTISRLIDGCME